MKGTENCANFQSQSGDTSIFLGVVPCRGREAVSLVGWCWKMTPIVQNLLQLRLPAQGPVFPITHPPCLVEAEYQLCL